MRIPAALFALTLSLPPVSSVAAHEFWIEPPVYQVAPDGQLQGALFNGQEFNGTQLAFLPQRFERFTVSLGMRQGEVENRLGATPALDIPAFSEGLHVISYQSGMATLGYSEWEKFVKFAEHKDFEDYEARHDARNIPREGFDEGYWRYAKTLIGAGNSIGTDFRTGLDVEYVALDNPYTADLSDGMRVQLFYLDDVVADGQVELFEKAPDDTVTITLHRTDADGIAVLPVKAGHTYLVDHVVLRDPTSERAVDSGVAWETLWAALTFGVPE